MQPTKSSKYQSHTAHPTQHTTSVTHNTASSNTHTHTHTHAHAHTHTHTHTHTHNHRNKFTLGADYCAKVKVGDHIRTHNFVCFVLIYLCARRTLVYAMYNQHGYAHTSTQVLDINLSARVSVHTNAWTQRHTCSYTHAHTHKQSTQTLKILESAGVGHTGIVYLCDVLDMHHFPMQCVVCFCLWLALRTNTRPNTTKHTCYVINTIGRPHLQTQDTYTYTHARTA